MTQKTERVERLTLSSIKYRDTGWTDAAIKKFLGEEDATAPNPRYKCAAPMRLYNLDRIEKAEQTPEFAAWVDKSRKRREAAQEAADKRYDATVEEFSQVEVILYEKRPLEAVRRAAYLAWKAHKRWIAEERGQYFDEYDDSDATEPGAFSDRITSNYLRHERTNYEEVLEQIKGRVGVSTAYSLVKKAAEKAIGEQYPELA